MTKLFYLTFVNIIAENVLQNSFKHSDALCNETLLSTKKGHLGQQAPVDLTLQSAGPADENPSPVCRPA